MARKKHNTQARKKLKTHSGAAKRFRPGPGKRYVVDYKTFMQARVPVLLQTIRQRQAERAAAGGVIPPAPEASFTANDGFRGPSMPLRAIGKPWKSGHPGKRHLNSKMPHRRSARLRQPKIWGSGPINRLLHRMIGSHY